MSWSSGRTGRYAVRAGLLAVAVTAAGLPAAASPVMAHGGAGTVRFATFNASLNRGAEGALRSDLSTPANAQARTIAEIVQRTRPDVLLVNEFDFDPVAARLFQQNYLSVGQHGARPVHYPHRFVAPSNTGIASGFDLNNDGLVATEPGTTGYGDDALGFGAFPGQYGMVVYSRYPIELRQARTFQEFRWKDMPGALLPDDPDTTAPADWYSPEELAAVRLSSKSHWDLPVQLGRRTVHFLVSHPTPPVFDGAEDRNGRRNFDEIRFWADYVRPGAGRYIYDDRGRRGGLRPGAEFVIAGDLNSDPNDGDSLPDAARQLLDHRWIHDRLVPGSAGAAEAAAVQGGANPTHRSEPVHDTADFADVPGPGNLRADYVLPSRGLDVRGGGVFWPVAGDPLSRLTGTFPFPSSDHRLVWLDLRVRR
ncbi:endonuclease/exonuclease/phosphatase family protein [Micromonospora sp. WMMD1102]|uniref:endonuclease/exonuclease/phosphatase family protein n=1 Tax=Micromonospora sp. WMMD1102 TaxID=3016105 RepID=UPI0024158882|nr:endonuclease/exonuclease/phosphatase family protein [Micromonospora sp. WMMD1102]MDG4787975.1 endonuclease/exonuclease/phosphatase family protein [Micromonospora sp. WMMD1102]